MTKERVILKGISSAAWEHPADKAALQAVKNIPGLDAVLKAIFGATTEKSIRLVTLASAVRAGEKQFSRVYSIHRQACSILDMPYIPEIYVSQNPFLNAGAVGMDKPFVTLNSSVIDILNDEELLGIIGHELGHIKSGHVLYKTLLYVLLQLSSVAFNIPVTGLVLAGIIAALKEWDRKSELSSDRAGLLTVQNPDVYIGILMKLAGGRQLQEMNLGEFIKQAEEYENASGLLDNTYKLLNILTLSHPFPVTRILELINWVRTGAYDAMLSGNYHEEPNDVYSNFREAASGYQKEASDVLKKTIDSVKEGSKKARNLFDDFTKA
jgi:Zn-dependent protease with chaperone function